MIRNADDLVGVGDADQNGPAVGVGERAQLSANVLGQRALELNRGPFAAGYEVGDGVCGHTAICPFMSRGKS